MADFRLPTAYKRIQGFHPMNQALLHQEIKRPIHGRRLGRRIKILKGFKKIVGFD